MNVNKSFMTWVSHSMVPAIVIDRASLVQGEGIHRKKHRHSMHLRWHIHCAIVLVVLHLLNRRAQDQIRELHTRVCMG